MSFNVNTQFSGRSTKQESQLSGVGTITTGIWKGSVIDLTEIEGTNILSTGETVTNKFLRTDADGTSSWQHMLHIHDIEGDELLSTGVALNNFLRADGDNSCSWQEISPSAIEGSAILSTGEGITKFLRADGDNTSSWNTIAIEGTNVLSTGETGNNKVLRDKGDNSSSWFVITKLGIIGTGAWEGSPIENAYIANALTISGGDIEDTPIGASNALSGKFITIIGTSITDSSDLSTGALQISGGAAIPGNLNIGLNLEIISSGAVSIFKQDSDNSNITQIAFQSNIDGNYTIDVPESDGTLCVSASGLLSLSAAGAMSFTGIAGTAVESTGEGITKFLQANGDNSSSWQYIEGD